MHEPPADFVARLKMKCGSDWNVRYNTAVNRWEITSLSAAGRPVSQFWGWYKNPLTGEQIEPDPVTGLCPYRDLDPAAQTEMLANLEQSFIGNREDGAKDWETYSGDRMKHNTALNAKAREQRADDWSYALQQVDLKRRWLSDAYVASHKKEIA